MQLPQVRNEFGVQWATAVDGRLMSMKVETLERANQLHEKYGWEVMVRAVTPWIPIGEWWG